MKTLEEFKELKPILVEKRLRETEEIQEKRLADKQKQRDQFENKFNSLVQDSIKNEDKFVIIDCIQPCDKTGMVLSYGYKTITDTRVPIATTSCQNIINQFGKEEVEGFTLEGLVELIKDSGYNIDFLNPDCVYCINGKFIIFTMVISGWDESFDIEEFVNLTNESIEEPKKWYQFWK